MPKTHKQTTTSPGRPRRAGGSFIRVGLDLLPAERDSVMEASGLAHTSMAAFMRRAVLEAAHKVLSDKGL